MRKTLMIAAVLCIGCSATKQATRLDSVAVNVDGVDHKIPLAAAENADLSELQGACVTPDLKHARLLRKGRDCDDGWVAVKGNKAR